MDPCWIIVLRHLYGYQRTERHVLFYALVIATTLRGVSQVVILLQQKHEKHWSELRMQSSGQETEEPGTELKDKWDLRMR